MFFSLESDNFDRAIHFLEAAKKQNKDQTEIIVQQHCYLDVFFSSVFYLFVLSSSSSRIYYVNIHYYFLNIEKFVRLAT